MINGVGNLLSFADNNVSYNNQLESYLESYKDNSFAEMLNKAQNENINLENSDDRSVNTENYNKDDYNKYSEARENERMANNNDNLKTESDKEKFTDEKNIDNKEAKSSLNSLEDAENQTEENSDNKEFLSENEKKIESLKEKAKKLQNIIENEENNGLLVKNSKIIKKTEKENLIKEINNLKKEIENLESKELSDNEKEDLSILSASLENIKNILFENAKEIKENIIKKEELKNINDLKTKDLEQRNQKEIKENIKDAEINKNTEISADDKDNRDNFKNNFNLENNIENKLNKRENKIENLNSNGNLNRSISEDKGAELTIINMKDSPEGANLKGFNHYNNNVSKTQSGLAENMIKFQDLMGKLVEKAQVAINNGKSEVLMSLNPEYLGKVRLKISMDGDNFVGKIFVDNAEIKDIFTKNLDTVITSLNEIGINIEGFDVMLRQDMPNGEFAEFDDNNPFKGFANEAGDFAEEVKADIRNYIIPERKLNLLI